MSKLSRFFRKLFFCKACQHDHHKQYDELINKDLEGKEPVHVQADLPEQVEPKVVPNPTEEVVKKDKDDNVKVTVKETVKEIVVEPPRNTDVEDEAARTQALRNWQQKLTVLDVERNDIIDKRKAEADEEEARVKAEYEKEQKLKEQQAKEEAFRRQKELEEQERLAALELEERKAEAERKAAEAVTLTSAPVEEQEPECQECKLEQHPEDEQECSACQLEHDKTVEDSCGCELENHESDKTVEECPNDSCELEKNKTVEDSCDCEDGQHESDKTVEETCPNQSCELEGVSKIDKEHCGCSECENQPEEQQVQPEKPAPKKRGRKPKQTARPASEEETVPAPEVFEYNEQDDDDDTVAQSNYKHTGGKSLYQYRRLTAFKKEPYYIVKFESANGDKYPCEVAYVKVENGLITETYQSLIKLPRGINMGTRNTHNITKETLKNAPTFPKVWPVLKKVFNKESTIIPTNSRTDTQSLRVITEHYKYNVQPFMYNDTVDLMKDKLKIEKASLHDLYEHNGYNFPDEEMNALEQCLATKHFLDRHLREYPTLKDAAMDLSNAKTKIYDREVQKTGYVDYWGEEESK